MGKTARTDFDCRSHPPPRYRKPYLSVLQHRKLCIPAGITAIEIENRCMTLIKWSQARAAICVFRSYVNRSAARCALTIFVIIKAPAAVRVLCTALQKIRFLRLTFGTGTIYHVCQRGLFFIYYIFILFILYRLKIHIYFCISSIRYSTAVFH